MLASARMADRMFPASERAPLECDVDVFNGCKVLPSGLDHAPNDFSKLLSDSVSLWKAEGRTSVWLFIPNDKADLIPIALKQGFDYHHAKPGNAALIKWLPENTKSMIPLAPFTRVGVGAVIFNSRDELLCVQECNGPLRGLGIWKIPTGSADPGENIGRAAEREVWEETGVQTAFHKVLLIRHRYPSPTSTCDLYFVCALHLKSDEDKELVVDETELDAAKWVSYKDYLAQPCWGDTSTMARVYREEIHPTIGAYRSGEFQGLTRVVGDATDAKYGNHCVYKPCAAPVRPITRLASLFRPLSALRRLVRL